MGYLHNIILQQFEFQNKKKGGQPKKNLVIVLSNS